MAKLFKDTSGVYHLNDVLIQIKPSIVVSDNSTYITIYDTVSYKNTMCLYSGLISDLQNESGTSYSNYAGLIAACPDLFNDNSTINNKGTFAIINNAIGTTTTSNAIESSKYNAALVSLNITGTGTWNVNLQGAFTFDGTFMDIYDNQFNKLTTGNQSTSMMKLFIGIPNYIKLVTTEVTDGATCTTKIQLLNV